VRMAARRGQRALKRVRRQKRQLDRASKDAERQRLAVVVKRQRLTVLAEKAREEEELLLARSAVEHDDDGDERPTTVDKGKPSCAECDRLHPPPCQPAEIRAWLESGRPRCQHYQLRHALACEFAPVAGGGTIETEDDSQVHEMGGESYRASQSRARDGATPRRDGDDAAGDASGDIEPMPVHDVLAHLVRNATTNEGLEALTRLVNGVGR